ncbi:MAG: hypothetical protein JSS83_12555 [Cyanobacteria bacterium SZAS LIN-3]|nr:hypothetical protein [Cyanobacteria bacterium SZAS LIN-3]MBS2009149.1 hypothetical protein [Cyanobacteria bacterium SZAS TMP-1]
MTDHRTAHNTDTPGDNLARAANDLTAGNKSDAALDHWLQDARHRAYTFTADLKDTAQKAPIGTTLGIAAVAVAAYGAVRTGLATRALTRLAGGETLAVGERLAMQEALVAGESRAMVHLTSAEGGVGIANTLKVGGRWGIFGLEKSQVPESALLRNIKSLVTRDLSHEVPIGPNASAYFRAPTPVGPFSLARRLGGVKSTPIGSIDLVRDAFIPNEIFANGVFRQATTNEVAKYKMHQWLLDYGVDSLAYTYAGFTTAAYEYSRLCPPDEKRPPTWREINSRAKNK